MNASKSWLRLVAAGIILLAAMLPSKKLAAQDYYSDGSSYQEFYDELSPYGQWMNDPQYGYVWVPSEGRDFRPYYTNGYWVNTEYGNTWVSNYDWGWAPFHYGRWTFDDYYGWLWIPGQEWGPAWVNWRNGGGYYGWAPLGPGISVDISFGGWNAPSSWWVFTPQQYVMYPNFHNYCRPPQYNTTIINNTTVINNTYVHNHNTYVSGPRRRDLEAATGRTVQQYRVNDARSPRNTQVRGNEVAIFRPTISRNSGDARPQRVATQRSPISATPRDVSPVRNSNQPVRSGNPVLSGRGGIRTEESVRPMPAREPIQTRTPVREAQQPRNYEQPPAIGQQPVRQQQQPERNWNAARNDRPVMQQPAQQAPRQQPLMDRPQRTYEAPRQERPQMQQRVQEQPRSQPVRQQRPVEQSRPAPQVQPQQREAAPARDNNGIRGMRR